MEFLETAIVVVHILVSLSLVGLVLLQQGKGAEAGASFGAGASQTVFGSQGSGNFLTKMTKYLAFVFFITSIGLAVIAKEKAEVAAAGEVLAPVAQEEDAYNQSSEDVKESLELEAGKPEGFADESAPELE